MIDLEEATRLLIAYWHGDRFLDRSTRDACRQLADIVKQHLPNNTSLAVSKNPDGYTLDIQNILTELAQNDINAKGIISSLSVSGESPAKRNTAAKQLGSGSPVLIEQIMNVDIKGYQKEKAKKIKVLILASNPASTSQLKIQDEIRQIYEKIRLSEHRDTIELIPALAAKTTDLLQLFNQHRPHIVHFSGHGSSSGEIILNDEVGNPVPISREAITSLFKIMRDDIRIVLLNSCYSETQAKAIADVIDYTIGMNDAIGDDAAISFAAAFYRAIGFGRSIKNAFDQAVLELQLKGMSDANIPQLIVRPGADRSKALI